MNIVDCIVVGSGCSGAMAAQTLVEAGTEVTMLDVGNENPEYNTLVPKKDFQSLRTEHTDQHRYFIGDQAEGVVWGDIGKGAQLTPARQHMVAMVDKYLPLSSKTFSPVESLGYGGLGIGWGLQCWEFSPRELEKAGMDVELMTNAYETVASRIGVSASRDDAAAYTLGALKNYQPSPTIDRNHKLIDKKYRAHKKRLHEQGFLLGRTPLALLTRDHDGRKKYAYRDMDFYTDNDHSAWRPWMTVNKLKKYKNFSYKNGQLVTRFEEKDKYVAVHCLDVTTNKPTVFYCRKLILGTSAFGSARVVLRSFNKLDTALPLLCNPYTYIPCLQPTMVGKGVEPKKMGFTQMTLCLDEARQNMGASIASLYSYQSLMLFRIIRQAPFDFIDARTIMRYLMSGFVIMGVHHPDTRSERKYLKLIKDEHSPTGDKLKVAYRLDESELAENQRRERKFIRAMHSMGTHALSRVNPGYGSSIHYAGTLPFSQKDVPFTLSPNGRLHGTKNVYVADSAGFNYLPAKGVTFSLLANAHLTAERVLKDEQ
jgi:hypothetical protein